MTTKEFAKILQDKLTSEYGVDLSVASHQQIYRSLALICRQIMSENHKKFQSKVIGSGSKQVYYLCMEFLMGRSLKTSLFNLGLNEAAEAALAAADINIESIYEEEPDAGLGNGGLGRLAACFLDSLAALGLPGDGVGLNYHYGLFHQYLRNNKQEEQPDPWIEEQGWLIPTDVTFPVQFGNQTLNAVMWDIAVPGANTETANRLHLFDVEKPAAAPEDGIDFDKGDIAHHLTSFLYPDDSDEAGRLLRVYQQYFMVSAGAQLILKELDEKGISPWNLCEHVAIQINDTHPSMVLPELTRLLLERGLSMNDALHQVAHACAYTNHTILAEALEKWPMSYIERVAPQLVPIIRELDQRARQRSGDGRVAILDEGGRVHMAHMDIHYGHSVNGVAALHTEILKTSELKPFADVYSYKFNNKTNGITFRRWLIHCNPQLTQFLDETIGEGYKKDAAELEKLLAYKDDKKVLDKMLEIKHENKEALSHYLMETQGIEISPDTIFDIQVKRLHEYKRQQLNALYIIDKYLEIKSGKIPAAPVTAIFGAKAAPAYVIAKDIIHLILCLQEIINNDPEVSPYLKVVMVENYNVTKAGKLIPACDISEQISLASKEASGTGNMKFMLNGAVTLGTEDGANVEIHELVGDDNIYIFGKKPQDVIDLYDEKKKDPQAGYNSKAIYDKDPQIAKLVDFIVSDELLAIGDRLNLERLYKEILNKDWFMTLLDLKEYIQVKEKVYKDYENRSAWNKKCLINIANAGFFSSDRTIEQYNEDIWHLG